MRLPQSSIQSLSIRPAIFLTINVALLLFGLVPASLAATGSPLTCSPSNLRFGAIDVGQTETMLVSLSNGGQTSITLTGISASNSEFKTSSLKLPVTLLAGQSVDVNVSFTPTAIGWAGGTINFTSNASNPNYLLQVAGTGVSSEAATASPSMLSFGSVAMGFHATLPVTITNANSSGVTLLGIQVTGSEFSVSGASFPITLNGKQSISFNVIFTPQLSGEAGGSVFIYGPRLNVPLTGTGSVAAAGQLSVAPSPLSFGSVTVGTSATELITVSATGASVTVYSANSSNAQFALDGATFPFTVGAGKSVSFDVAFAPQGTGSESASLSFSSNASNPLVVESLSGTGAAAQWSVNLSWSPSQNVNGYNVYRSTTANGTYSKVNSTLDENTAYTDNTVTSGQTYYYEATAVNAAGQESAKSTPPVQAVVP